MEIIVIYHNKHLDSLETKLRPYTLKGIRENPSKAISKVIVLCILIMMISKSKNPNMVIFCCACSSLFSRLSKFIIH